jgi:ankyrin repeat protein
MAGQNGHYLLEATKKNNFSEVQRLLSLGNVSNLLQDDKGNTALHWAVLFNNPEMLGVLLDRLPQNARTLKRKDEYKALVLAAQKGYWDCVLKFALHQAIPRAGYDIALLLAVQANQYHVVNALLNSGAQCNARSLLVQRTSLHYAVINHNPKLLRLLLKQEANQTIQDDDGENPLELAINLPDWECLRVFAEFKIEANRALYDEALLRAASANKYHVVRALLKAGASPNHIDETTQKKHTPLHYSALNHNPEMAALLVRYGADIEAKDDEGSTPIKIAISYEDTRYIAWLISLKASTPALKEADESSSGLDKFMHDAITYAADNYKAESLNILDSNAYRPKKIEKLIAQGDIEGLTACTTRDINFDEPLEPHGLFPLSYAVKLNLVDVVQCLLLKIGKDHTCLEKAFDVAIENKNWACAKAIFPEKALVRYLDETYRKQLSFFSCHNTDVKKAFLREASKCVRDDSHCDTTLFYGLLAESKTARYRQFKFWSHEETHTASVCKQRQENESVKMTAS